MTLGELNARDRSAFVEAIGWVFEESPWVADRAWNKRPFATLDGLHDAMTEVVRTASLTEQLALLRAHPDLGTSRLQADRQMSVASQEEQRGVGLDELTRDELQRFGALNMAYREKFGFPFLYAVKGSTRHDILNALERRLSSPRDAEYQEALRQVYRIAHFRLEQAIGRAGL